MKFTIKRFILVFVMLMTPVANITACTQSKRSTTAAQATGQQQQQQASPPTQKSTAGKGAPTSVTPAPTKGKPVNSDFKVVAEGSHSRVADTFILIARDVPSYEILKSLVGKLPTVDADYFKTRSVVAAFLGTRTTGGYGVSIAPLDRNQLSITERAPAADMMVTQALTTPFKIVEVPRDPNSNASFDVVMNGTWQAATRPYRVTAGEFTMSGGIAGVSETFKLEGELRVMRYNDLATLFFNLRRTEGGKARALKTYATGTLQPNGQLNITSLNAGSLVEHPSSPLQVSGAFAKNEDNLSLTFTPNVLPNVSDSFNGHGKLQAQATAPAPAKRKQSWQEEDAR